MASLLENAVAEALQKHPVQVESWSIVKGLWLFVFTQAMLSGVIGLVWLLIALLLYRRI